MTKKARQVLAILGRKNATFFTVQRTQDILDTKKNAREILDEIIKDILYLKSVSSKKIDNAMNFITGEKHDAKMCVKCFVEKEISEFYLTKTNKNLHYWCFECRREYNKNYMQKIRQ